MNMQGSQLTCPPVFITHTSAGPAFHAWSDGCKGGDSDRSLLVTLKRMEEEAPAPQAPGGVLKEAGRATQTEVPCSRGQEGTGGDCETRRRP